MSNGIKIKLPDGSWSSDGIPVPDYSGASDDDVLSIVAGVPEWAAPTGAATPPQIDDFSSSTTFAKPSGAKMMLLEGYSGGGGGAAGTGTGKPGFGGASGSYGYVFVPAEMLPASITVTIGAGGNAGLSAAGGDGGDTIVAGMVLAKGGGGGKISGGGIASAGTVGAGASSGVSGNTTSTRDGANAPDGGTLTGGAGGPGALANPDVHSGAGTAPGAGGGGGFDDYGSIRVQGSAGAPGAVRITTYF